MHTKLSDTLPAWRIVEPLPADELVTIYRGGRGAPSTSRGRILAAINLVETGTGRIRGTSTAGAQGPMQFLPSTWAAYGAGGDINDTARRHLRRGPLPGRQQRRARTSTTRCSGTTTAPATSGA